VIEVWDDRTKTRRGDEGGMKRKLNTIKNTTTRGIHARVSQKATPGRYVRKECPQSLRLLGLARDVI
jgi:hypothetical protein